MFLVEEGAEADKVIDITKFQNFFFTIIVVIAYVAVAVADIASKNPSDLTTLPKFDASLLALLGISHAGYVGGKIPSRGGTPDAPSSAPLDQVQPSLKTTQ